MRRTKVDHPEKFIWMVLKRHFSFLMCAVRNDRTLVEDINQTGWVCFLEGKKEFKACYNSCQRELYALAKQLGFRRTQENKWILREGGDIEK